MTKHGMVFWMLGPTSSGKTTIAEALVGHLRAEDIPIIFYDGGEVRGLIGPGHGFSAEDRQRTVSGLVHLANKAAAAGLNVIVAALTASTESRAYITENVDNLVWAQVTCSIETCAERDPKGLYAMARNGEIDTLIGYNEEYVAVENPHIILDTETNGVDALVEEAGRFIMERL